MPNISDMSTFVIPNEDVKDGDTITFSDGGQLHTYEDGRVVIQFQVTVPSGKIKTLSLNRTSANNVAEAYGSDTTEWQGKDALISVVKMNVRGQLKNVIYLYPVK
jgi:hypothetical protein